MILREILKAKQRERKTSVKRKYVDEMLSHYRKRTHRHPHIDYYVNVIFSTLALILIIIRLWLLLTVSFAFFLLLLSIALATVQHSTAQHITEHK